MITYEEYNRLSGSDFAILLAVREKGTYVPDDSPFSSRFIMLRNAHFIGRPLNTPQNPNVDIIDEMQQSYGLTSRGEDALARFEQEKQLALDSIKERNNSEKQKTENEIRREQDEARKRKAEKLWDIIKLVLAALLGALAREVMPTLINLISPLFGPGTPPTP